ncbi:MAG: YrhK family protein [Brevibacterium sp.]|uniref:YrhK family protein n=1 Tax=Brevibacterium sandarakinum TaxID=629680 RepID=UPI002652D378|nr:YrhK family protein [Brevibacterium sandarakinum]MDN5587837.1 YrhK family protein [Brevibacterium sp.]MDN5656876.1 YrhK family protein [Brevibacterium sandarakinum]
MSDDKHNLIIRIGQDELVIRQRYQVLSIVNDVLIGIWFLIGSFMFFSDEWVFTGTCLFVLGSIEMLIRPVIRLIRHVHLQKIGGPETPPTDTTYDF